MNTPYKSPIIQTLNEAKQRRRRDFLNKLGYNILVLIAIAAFFWMCYLWYEFIALAWITTNA